MISRFPLTVFVVLAMLLLSCSTDTSLDELDGRWKAHGLDSVAVHSIYERNGKLYAGTDQGMYVSTGTERASWKDPKLNIEGIKHISLAFGDNQKIIAAVQYEPEFYEEENEVLFESSDDGKTWKGINEKVEGLTRYGEPVSFFHSLAILVQSPL